MGGEPHAAQVGHDRPCDRALSSAASGAHMSPVSAKPCSSRTAGPCPPTRVWMVAPLVSMSWVAETGGERLHLRQRGERKHEGREQERRDTQPLQVHAVRCLRYSPGAHPYSALKRRPKWERSEKPQLKAMSPMVRRACAGSSSARRQRSSRRRNDVALEPGPLLRHERVGIAHADAGCRCGADRLQVRIVQAGFYRCLQHGERGRARVREVDAVRLGLRR